MEPCAHGIPDPDSPRPSPALHRCFEIGKNLMIGKIVTTVSGLLIAVFLAYLVGMWTTYKVWWPWEKVTELQLAWRSYRATGMFLPEDSYVRRDAGASGKRYLVNDAAAVSPGLLALNRYDPKTGTYVFELIDEAGKVVHSRTIDYARIVKGGASNRFVHIARMRPDGSLLVVFDDDPGLARIDACGDPIWVKSDQNYHHAIEQGDNGYWTWQAKNWNGGNDQRMVRFDPETGDILESIDLRDVVNNSPENRLKMVIPDDFEFTPALEVRGSVDLFHPNDVDPLRADMAAAFPQFKAGDLLISLRNIDMLAVIDRQTKEILWSQYGPWKRQHDPNFQPDGTITVMSNNVDRFRSSIIRVDPKTGKSRDMFAGSGLDFDTFIMGRQDRLPNGNWLITATMQGRVIEVNPKGEIVREYNNILNDKYNSIVLYAELLAPDYLAAIPSCQK
jgi:Arylsulfotransferase (ASST)